MVVQASAIPEPAHFPQESTQAVQECSPKAERACENPQIQMTINKPGPKTAHPSSADARIQLRVPHQLKRIMRNRAKAHGMKLTAWILSRCA
jgi:predicted DNA binding CopG/RHH family protein